MTDALFQPVSAPVAGHAPAIVTPRPGGAGRPAGDHEPEATALMCERERLLAKTFDTQWVQAEGMVAVRVDPIEKERRHLMTEVLRTTAIKIIDSGLATPRWHLCYGPLAGRDSGTAFRDEGYYVVTVPMT